VLPLSNCSVFTYADDTALLIYGESWTETFKYAEVALNTVLNWLSCNLLTINLSKTVYMPFSFKPTSLKMDSLYLKAHTNDCNKRIVTESCSCPLLSRVATVKYLGVQIDNSLHWKSQLENLTGRVRKLTYIFKKLRHSADSDTIRTVYFALCQSVLTICQGWCTKNIILKARTSSESSAQGHV
jgi:hypothetical protein